MGRKKTSKKENKEPEILPATKKRRISLDDDDDIQIVAVEYGNPVKLEANFPKSDQQAKNMNDDGVFVREEDIPGPSNRNFQFEFGENAEIKPIAQINREFSQRRQEIMGNLQTSLTEMEDDYNRIAQLTETLHYDRQTKTRVKQEVDELAAEIAEKSAQKEILDKDLEKVAKRIETNEKTLETAEERIKSFEVKYKKEEEAANNEEEAGGKVGEYECPICKEICGNEQKQMVCISTCGHRFCKDCVDRVLAPANVRALRPAEMRARMQRRYLAARNAADGWVNFLEPDPIPEEAPRDFPPVDLNNHEQIAWRRRNLIHELNLKGRCPTCQKNFSKRNVIRLY